MSERLADADFAKQLRRAAGKRYHDSHPFHQRMHVGELSREELRRWIHNRFYYQRSLPSKDALIVAKLPTAELRRAWLGRIVEQDGASDGEGGLESWLGLAEAAGCKREDVLDDARTLPGVRFAVDAYVTFCRENTWWEGVAASLTQLQVPQLMEVRIAAFEEHYGWIAADGLDYFRRRREIEPSDSERALALVVDAADTRERQLRALAAVEFKCDVLNAILDAIDRA
jgi:pyrroloquinoline-quinone synthase